MTERSFAHVCETGGARRCWLRGLVKVSKRYLLQVAARNLSLIMRKLFGVGTPRGLQSESDASSLTDLIQILLATLWTTFWRAWNTLRSRAHLALRKSHRSVPSSPRRLRKTIFNSLLNVPRARLSARPDNPRPFWLPKRPGNPTIGQGRLHVSELLLRSFTEFKHCSNDMAHYLLRNTTQKFQRFLSIFMPSDFTGQPIAKYRKQRPQAEPEPAAFRFGFGHGGSPRGGQCVA